MIDSLTAAIVARLNTDIAGLGTCAAYPKIQTKVNLPAVLIDLESIEPDNYGSELFDCSLRYVAYCIVDPVLAGAYMTVRNLAATVATRIHQECDFGVDVVRGAEVIGIGEDNFRPELDGYFVWAVEFQVGVSIGEMQWLEDPAAGVPVTSVVLGNLDNIGIQGTQTADAPVTESLINLPEQPKG